MGLKIVWPVLGARLAQLGLILAMIVLMAIPLTIVHIPSIPGWVELVILLMTAVSLTAVIILIGHISDLIKTRG